MGSYKCPGCEDTVVEADVPFVSVHHRCPRLRNKDTWYDYTPTPETPEAKS